MLAHKEVLRPGLSQNKRGEVGGSAQLSLGSYGSSSFVQKSDILLFFLYLLLYPLLATTMSDVTYPSRRRLAFTCCRTVTSPLCLFQLLGCEQKGVLFDCNPTHLSLESGAFSIRLRRHNGILCLGKARRRLTSVTLHAS